MRYAIYFTPDRHAPLIRAAVRWLGRDAFGGPAVPPVAAGDMSAAEIEAATVSARRYGFHATLKAPFRLAEGHREGDLTEALSRFCAAREPAPIDRLALAQIDGFFALVPHGDSDAIDALAADIVKTFEPFRAPLSDADIARRRPETLSVEERRNLENFGYPYVFEQFQFHMTLTDRAQGETARRLRAAIIETFGPLADAPAIVDGLALFVEPAPGAPFEVRSYHRLGQAAERRSA